MSAAPLISIPRAVQSPKLAALNVTSPALLSSLITGASESVRRYCCRDFTQQAYEEYQTVGVVQKGVPILVRQPPIASISRIGMANRALLITNNNNQVNQRATVATDSLGMTLTTVASAVTTTTVLPYATYPTLQQLIAGIISVGNGWTAIIQNSMNGQSYNLWASTNLKPLQGAATCFVTGQYLEVYEDISTGYTGLAGMGGSWGDDSWGGSNWNFQGPGWRCQSETGEIYFYPRRGSLVLRIDYIGGFSEVPQSIQQACSDLVLWTYQSTNRDMFLQSASLGDASYTLKDWKNWPVSITNALDFFWLRDRITQY